jgi:DNA-binding IclR family transcriptional regulator
MGREMVKKTGAQPHDIADEDMGTGAPVDEVGVAAVNRALAILDSFTAERSVLTLAQMSQKTGLYKSTILRLLQSLEAFGYVHKLNSGSYILGPAPVRLAALATKALHPAETVMPVLRDLVETTRESASFYVRSGTMRLCSYRVDSPRSIRDHVHVGQLLPLDKGAGGHVLKDFETSERSPIARSTTQLVRVSRGERDAETAAVACPVFGAHDKLEGALSLSGPINRFGEAEVESMIPPLIRAACALTIAFMGDAAIFSAAM